MFGFRKKDKGDENSEDVRILRAKNEVLELEVQKIALELERLSQKDEKIKGIRNDSSSKDAYEAQVNKLEEKNAQLENKLKEMDQMLQKMKEIEKKKTEDPPQRPLLNTPPNWAPPNSSSYGGPPQQPGSMQFSGYYQPGNLPQSLGNMQYPNFQQPGCPPAYQLSGNPQFSSPPNVNSPRDVPFAGHQGPRGPRNPNQAPNYSQPSGQYQRGQSSFQPRGPMFRGDNSQRGRGGVNTRFHWSRDEQGFNNASQPKNFGVQGRENEIIKPPRRDDNKSSNDVKDKPLFLKTDGHNRACSRPRQRKDNTNPKQQEERDDNKSSNDVKDKPLFIKTDGHNRARSRPRQRKDNANPKHQEERNGEENDENQKKVRFEHRGRNRGRPYNAGRAMQNRNHEYPDHHDRRTNFKRSSRGRPRNYAQRNTGDAGNIDSDDLSESEEVSGDENNAVDHNSLQSSVPVQSRSNQNMPDITKVEKKTQKKKTVKKNLKKGETEKDAEAEESEGGTAEKKQSNENAENDDKPLSSANLGKDDLLLKFIGCNIPSPLDVVHMQINLSRKVSGVVIMSDPDDSSPVLESPKTLSEIVQFKIKHPKAKSILL